MATLIKGGLVYDGSGMAPVKADILVSGEYIARVGDGLKARADETVDAVGAVVTPGFIDIGSEIDHYLTLFSEPDAPSLIRQGITTALVGNGGISLAPLARDTFHLFNRWVPEHRMANVHAGTIGELLARLTRHGTGINVGTLAGHATFRHALAGDEPRDLTERELQLLVDAVARACREGAFGLSIGFSEAVSRGMPLHELTALARAVKNAGRVLAVDLRNGEGDFLHSLERIMELAQATGVTLELNRMEPLAERQGEYEKAFELLDKATASANFYFDCYPLAEIPVPLRELLPQWLRDMPRAAALRYMKTEDGARRITAHLEQFRDGRWRVLRVGHRHLASFQGKLLAEHALHASHAFGVAMLKFMEATELLGTLAAPRADMPLLARFLAHNRALIAGGGTAGESKTFTGFIRAAQKGLLPLERAIKKLTALPAEMFGIAGRGAIKTGFSADIAVFHNGVPSDVLVNGTFAMKNGRATTACAGKALRPLRQ